MDQFMVNSNNETLEVGDEVVLIGEQEGQSITVEEMSGWVETIPYEILTNLNDRIPRIYTNG
jgi:alanine racemase